MRVLFAHDILTFSCSVQYIDVEVSMEDGFLRVLRIDAGLTGDQSTLRRLHFILFVS